MISIQIEGRAELLVGAPGEDLLEILQRADVPIATACGGVASCGLCRITVRHGGALLTPLRPRELEHLGNVARLTGARLACQSVIVASEAPAREGQAILVEVPPVERDSPPRLDSNPLRIEWRPNRTPK